MTEQNKDPAELWIIFGTAANGHPFPFAARTMPESAAFVAGDNPERHVACYVPKSELDAYRTEAEAFRTMAGVTDAYCETIDRLEARVRELERELAKERGLSGVPDMDVELAEDERDV